jgi:hypothetical protein
MRQGFCLRSSPLSFVGVEKIKALIFRDEDLHQAGLKMILPHKSQYSLSYLCSSCRLYIVDYGMTVSSSDAKALAASAKGNAPCI